MSFITLGMSSWLRVENRSNWRENRPSCVWKCKTERLTDRQECKTFQVLWKEQKNPLIREAGDRTLYLAHTLQNRAFYLSSLHDAPSLFLFHSFSFTIVSTLLLAVAGILTTGNSRVGLGQSQAMNCCSRDGPCPKCSVSTPKLPNQSGLRLFWMLLALTYSPVTSLTVWPVTHKPSMHIQITSTCCNMQNGRGWGFLVAV